MAVLNGKKHTAMWGGIDVKTRSALQDAVIRFDTVNTAPTTTTGHRYLYTNSSSQLVYDNGSSTVIVGAAGAAATTWEALFLNDSNLAMTATGLTMSQSGNAMALTLTKTGTGAGAVLLTNNAGTGVDFDVANTNEADATGIITQFHYDAGTPADDDIPLEIRVNADDDGGTETTLSTVRWYQRDVTAATDDAEFYMTLMVDGTERQVLQIDTDSVEIGNGAAAAVLSSSGAYDLTLETNRGTDSGTITITDAANGNIQIAPNGTGVLDLNSGFDIDASSTETCTITVVGTTGNGLAIDSATITSGNLVYINHSVSGTLDGGNLLALAVDGANVATWGETGVMTLAGSAVGTSVVTLTAGDLTLSDGRIALTSTGTTDVVSVTANSLLANNALIVAGSGAFTGTGASSFVAITPTGATTGTGLYIALAAATTLSYALDITTSTTTGTAARLTNTGILTGVGAALSIIADSATTPGNAAGEGVVNISTDGLTTGFSLNVESLSNELMTSGGLADFAHSASGTTVAAKTDSVFRVTSSITESGTSSQDYDVMAITRTSIHDTAGTLTAAGSVLRLEVVSTETAATLSDTVDGLEVVMGAVSGGDGVQITHSGTTTGRALNITASQTTSTVALLTMNSLTTTGVGLSLTNTGTGMTTGSVLRVASGTTGAVATNGIVSLFATGAFTSTAVTDGFVRVNANSTLSGTAVAINGNSFTTGVGLYIGDTGTGMTSGSLLRVSSGTTGAVATNGVVNFVASGAHTSTSNMGFVNVSDATATGVAMSISANSLTTGTGLRVASSGTITSSGVGLVHISGTGITSGDALRIAMTEATITTGNYINCYDGAASDFTVARYGATTIAGNAALTAALTITAGDFLMSDGVFQGATSAAVTAAVGSSQGDGPITRSFVEISVCANAGDAVTLPSAAAGQFVIITNHGANAADVFPASGDTINEGTVDVATSIAVNETFLCWAYDTGNWEVTQLARNS